MRGAFFESIRFDKPLRCCYFLKPNVPCTFFGIIIFDVTVIRGGRIGVLFGEGLAYLRAMEEGEVEIVRPAGMAGNNHHLVISRAEISLQRFQ